ncbi:hypothetical protein, partial [Gelidibacter salicanalis]
QGLNNLTASVLNLLGKTYLENGKLDNAKRVLFEGLELSRQNDIYEELAKGNQYLAAYFAQIGDFKKAFEYQSQFVSLNDSLENIASRDRLALMQGM